MTQLAVALI